VTHLLEGISFASQGKGKPVGILVPPHPVRDRLPVRVEEPQPLQHISMPHPADTSQAVDTHKQPTLALSGNNAQDRLLWRDKTCPVCT